MICRRYANNYCIEDISLIENYEEAVNDKSTLWVCHHRRETHNEDGTLKDRSEFISATQLREMKLYYMRPASELIFMTKRDHNALHRPGAGYKWTEEQRKRKSEQAKKVVKTPEWNKKNSEGCIRRHAHYIILPDGTITTTRQYHDEHNLTMSVSDMNGYVRRKGYLVDHGKHIPVIYLGKDFNPEAI